MGKISKWSSLTKEKVSEDIDKSLAKTSRQLKISETIVCQKLLNGDVEVKDCFWKNFFKVWKGLAPDGK